MNGIEQTLIGGIAGGTAIVIPALGELTSELSGIVNLGTEGCMLAGALGAYAVTVATGSAEIGIAGGAVAGAIFGLLHAYLTVYRKADQLTSGLVIWFLALGVTGVLGTGYVNDAITPLPIVSVPGLSQVPWLGPILFRQDLLVYVGYFLVALIIFVLHRSRIGLLLRATGERPEVVSVAGIHPNVIQVVAVTVGALLAGIGGAQLSVGYVGTWFDDMTSGYGFVAVAVVLFASWRPLRVMVGAYVFGVALSAESVLQTNGIAINQYLLDALPYLVTLIALVVVSRRGGRKAPEALSRALTDVT